MLIIYIEVEYSDCEVPFDACDFLHLRKIYFLLKIPLSLVFMIFLYILLYSIAFMILYIIFLTADSES